MKLYYQKIKKHLKSDEQLGLFYDRMNKKIKVINNPENYNVQVFCKSRIVNPLCKHNGQVKRVSDINTSWITLLEQQSKPKQYFLKFER